MQEIIITYLPWALSANTIYFTLLAGNKNKYAWLLALAGQFFWLVWIIASDSWGFLPMNLGMLVVYYRNHIKWSNA